MNSIKAFIYSVFLVAALIFLGWYMVIPYQNPEITTITVQEKYVPHSFVLVDRETGRYRCEYCDEITRL